MILLSELSRRRIRSINKLVRVGRDECAVVVRVDQDKGYIDLSKRRLSDEEKVKCANKFEKVSKKSFFVYQVGSNDHFQVILRVFSVVLIFLQFLALVSIKCL